MLTPSSDSNEEVDGLAGLTAPLSLDSEKQAWSTINFCVDDPLHVSNISLGCVCVCGGGGGGG